MSLSVALHGIDTPMLVVAAGERAGVRFLEFFASGLCRVGGQAAVE